jgi:prepilin-type N-terminal cleavage/methylation domain-containing protein
MSALKPKSQMPSGFTLVEILLVVSIMAIMSAASIPGFRGYIIAQNTKQSMEQVKSDLRSIQIKAMAGSLSDDSSVSYWDVTFRENRNNYDYLTSNASFGGGVSRGVSENLVGDVVVKQNRSIFFHIPTGDAYTIARLATGEVITPCAADGANCTVLVGGPSATGNNCARILVNSAGALFEQEQVSCTP